MASTQKALLVTEIGKPLVLVHDRPIARPGPDQVQLKVSVAGLNPHDQRGRDDGLLIEGYLPAVLAGDVVGTVSQVGEGVGDIKVGDRVVTSAKQQSPGSLQGGLQEYAIADIHGLCKIPDNISDDEAATLPINLVATWVALFHTLQIPAPSTPDAARFASSGAPILIVGGGSNCGKFAVQLAKLAGISEIVVVGGAEAELKALGATHVIDRHGGYDAVLKEIRDIVDDELVYALDAVNPPDGLLLALGALSNHKKGVLARLLPMMPVDESKVLGKQAGFEIRDVLGSFHRDTPLVQSLWKNLPGYLETGSIRPSGFEVIDGFEADCVNEALNRYRDGGKAIKPHIRL